MRYADLQYSSAMCEDFAVTVGEVFALTEDQICKIKRLITDNIQEVIEENE